MTHTRDHIIISSVRNTVSFGDPAVPASATPGKLRLWHLGAALLLIGFILGKL